MNFGITGWGSKPSPAKRVRKRHGKISWAQRVINSKANKTGLTQADQDTGPSCCRGVPCCLFRLQRWAPRGGPAPSWRDLGFIHSGGGHTDLNLFSVNSTGNNQSLALFGNISHLSYSKVHSEYLPSRRILEYHRNLWRTHCYAASRNKKKGDSPGEAGEKRVFWGERMKIRVRHASWQLAGTRYPEDMGNLGGCSVGTTNSLASVGHWTPYHCKSERAVTEWNTSLCRW